MNNVIDEVLDTTQTDNKVKYTLTHADGTTELVQLDLATPITVAGTPLNKLLFDSIQDDLNTRLLISNKATNNEAIAGTDTSKYIVPSTLQAKLNKMNSYKTGTASGGNTGATTTIFQPSDIGSATTGTVIIDGTITASGTGQYAQNIVINGTTLYGYEQYVERSDSTVALKFINSNQAEILAERSDPNATVPVPFKIIINLDRKNILVKTVIMHATTSQTHGIREAFMSYSALTNIRLYLRSGTSNKNSTASYSITYTR